jgi:hypothetical protein
MRVNRAGVPGKYLCDRCGKPSPHGVYTGDLGFCHSCIWCHAVYRTIVPDEPGSVLALPKSWLVVSVAEMKERVKTSERIGKSFAAKA